MWPYKSSRLCDRREVNEGPLVPEVTSRTKSNAADGACVVLFVFGGPRFVGAGSVDCRGIRHNRTFALDMVE